VRVISGTAGGIKLDVGPNRDVRPTIDRVREATFNALFSLNVIDGAHVLDLFGGTGALGIEALSRGAAHAVFVEHHRATAEILRANLERCRLAEQATVITSDADAWLSRLDLTPGSTDTFDLALLDPPYAFEEWPTLLGKIPATTVVVESSRPVELGDDFEVLRQRKYGSTVVTIAMNTAMKTIETGGDVAGQPATSPEGEQ